MDNHTTQTTPNAGTTEPVPAPPHQPRRGAARTPRAWLQCLGPTPPGSYLAPTERCLLRTNLHWILPLRTTVKAAAALALTSTLTFLTPGLWWLHTGLWAATLAYHTCLAYQVLAWRAEQLVLTDRRLIRTTGVITTTIDAVHLATITDTTYHQSLPGHLLGYGSLRIETPGQTQALEHLDHLPDPGAVYQALQR